MTTIHPSALLPGDIFALPERLGVFGKPSSSMLWRKVVTVECRAADVKVRYQRLADPYPTTPVVVLIPRTESVLLRRQDAARRIAFAGASGTGKTTRMNAVAEALGLPTCPVGSRSVAEAMGFASPYDVDKAGQRRLFQKRLLEQKSAWEKDHERTGFVTDRTHYDNLAYAIMHCPELLTDDYVLDVVKASAVYTAIILCPMATFWNLGNDPARVKDRAYHEAYDILIQGLLHRYSQRSSCPGPGYVVDTTGADVARMIRNMGWDKTP